MAVNLDKTVAGFKNHSFDAVYAADRKEALARVLELVPEGASVAVPGSATVREIGVVESLEEKGHQVFDHWKDKDPTIRKKQQTADVIITSANAAAMTGEIVNMDGIGNRVAPTIFGPAQVIFVVGKNKIAEDLDSARKRVKEVAAPKRAKELGMKTPCAETGECNECNSPFRICRAEVIIHRPPSLTKTAVVIVDEDLGN